MEIGHLRMEMTYFDVLALGSFSKGAVRAAD